MAAAGGYALILGQLVPFEISRLIIRARVAPILRFLSPLNPVVTINVVLPIFLFHLLYSKDWYVWAWAVGADVRGADIRFIGHSIILSGSIACKWLKFAILKFVFYFRGIRY